MKKEPILLGSLRRAASSGDFEDDERDLQYDLKRPAEIVIADDNNALQNFGDTLFTAPQEDILEGFGFLFPLVLLSDNSVRRVLCAFRVPPAQLSGQGRVQDQRRNQGLASGR
jgi:hypothetical protein